VNIIFGVCGFAVEAINKHTGGIKMKVPIDIYNPELVRAIMNKAVRASHLSNQPVRVQFGRDQQNFNVMVVPTATAPGVKRKLLLLDLAYVECALGSIFGGGSSSFGHEVSNPSNVTFYRGDSSTPLGRPFREFTAQFVSENSVKDLVAKFI